MNVDEYYDQVKKHEYGHYLQYKKYGGDAYIQRGWNEKGVPGAFEFEADVLATHFFGEPICDYLDGNHPIPACRQ